MARRHGCPSCRTSSGHGALVVALLALCLLAGCGTAPGPAANNGNAAVDPAAEAESSRSWSVPMVERRIRDIETNDFDDFVKTDLGFKEKQERANAAKNENAARSLLADIQKYFDAIQHHGFDHSQDIAQEDFFTFKKVKWEVDPKTETIPGTGERGGPNKQRVFVAVTFASPADSPSVGNPSRKLKRARVSYAVTPHGVDRTTYGDIRLVDGSAEYW